MVMTDRIQSIFQDARELQADALEILSMGKIHNAAEKAWGATKRASDALVLARTGEEPERTPETGAGLQMLASWTKRCGKPASCAATTAGRSCSTASASATASAKRPLRAPGGH